MEEIVKKIIELEWLERKDHIQKKKASKSVIWVSDLARCKRAREYDLVYDFMFTVRSEFVLGKLMHLGFYEYLKELYGPDNVRIEVELGKKIGNYLVKGRVDAIVNNDFIIELKTGRDIPTNEPSEHHVIQVKAYLWLAGLEKAKLIYLTRAQWREFEISEPYNDDEIELLINSDTSPRWDWECDYCIYSQFCTIRKGKERR